MSDKEMCYVAADPEQPGAAWALCVDDPRFDAQTTRNVASWVKAGAHIRRVDIDTGMSMLRKWKRPEFLPLLPEQQAVSDRINGGE